MTAEPYVPTLLVVRHAVSFPRERLGEPLPISGDAFDRFIAKIKADALREFVDSAQDLLDCSGDTRWKSRALNRAARIEEEA